MQQSCIGGAEVCRNDTQNPVPMPQNQPVAAAHSLPSVRSITCPRCQGRGQLPEFRHVEAGVCFRCRGARVILTQG